MDYKTLNYEVADDIALLTLNRPDRMNALTSMMRAEITHAVAKSDRRARVLVITGSGKAFSAGQDLGDHESLDEVDLEGVLKEEYEPMIRAIHDVRIPVIAAVNGPAVGAGASLALACDAVIAAKSAYFMQAFANIGLIPDAGSTYWLPRKVGFARAMGAALFADRISAEQAVDWGMIWECVEDTEFAETWQARAAHLSRGAAQSYQFAKRALRLSFDQTLSEQFETEAHFQGRASRSLDFKEGVLAFIEKRIAVFKGR